MAARERCPAIDFGNMIAGVLEGGIDPDRLRGDLAERFRDAHAEVEARRAAGEMGFFDLPGDRALASATRRAADRCGRGVDAIVVIGIGGSALGAAALRDALLPPFWNELDGAARGDVPRLPTRSRRSSAAWTRRGRSSTWSASRARRPRRWHSFSWYGRGWRACSGPKR